MKIGIFNETDDLKSVVTWGALGAEAVLAQFYPPHISLFLDDMNVMQAREEALEFASTLNKFNVTTHFARDIFADSLTPTAISFNTVLNTLIQKADDIRSEFSTSNHPNYKEVIEQLLKMDVDRYGKNKALTLNWKLSLYPRLPLGNLIYARDQMNVLLSKRVRSHMKKEIRKPEIELYETVYQKLFPKNKDTIILPLGETFEGGDAYIHDDTIYIGIGSRTTIGAALFIYKELEEEINKSGYKFALIVDNDSDKRSLTEQMLFMHLDTFSNPVGRRQIAVCLSEAKRRSVKLIQTINSKTHVIDTGKSFLDYLFEDGQEIVAIPDTEQQTFGCNFLLINNDTILVPLQTNRKTISNLENLGKKIHYVGLEESTKGFGAAHCMTGQLRREIKS